MLGIRGDHDVARLQAQAGDHRVAALGRGRGQRDPGRVGADQRRDRLAQAHAHVEHLLEERVAGASLGEGAQAPQHLRLGRLRRQRAERARVQIRRVLEDGKLGADLLEVHAATAASTGA